MSSSSSLLLSKLSSLRLDCNEDELQEDSKRLAIHFRQLCPNAEALEAQMLWVHRTSLQCPTLAAQTAVLYSSLRHLEVDDLKCRNLILTNVQRSFAQRESMSQQLYYSLVALIVHMFLRFRLSDQSPVGPLLRAVVMLLDELLRQSQEREDGDREDEKEEEKGQNLKKSQEKEKGVKKSESEVENTTSNDDKKESKWKNEISENPQASSNESEKGASRDSEKSKEQTKSSSSSSNQMSNETSIDVFVRYIALMGPELSSIAPDDVEYLMKSLRTALLRRPCMQLMFVLEYWTNKWVVSEAMLKYYPNAIIELIKQPNFTTSHYAKV